MAKLPNFGLLALAVAAGGLLTGPFLALNYAPTFDAARDSVHYIQNDVALGWLLRGLHHWSANFAIVLAAIHGWRIFWNGAYKKPRQFTWVIGGGIFLVLVGFAYTGYLLTGDERGYTGIGVMEQVAGSTPLVGEQASALMKGGPVVSSATLTRLYVVHTMVLPGALAGLVVAFLFALRKARATAGAAAGPGWRETLGRDAAATVAVCLLLAFCAWALPPPVGPKPDFGGAGAPDARPEWFFLWVNQLLHMVPGATFLVAGLLPGLLVGAGLSLPWIARGTQRTPSKRRVELIAAGAVLLAIGVLTALNVAQTPQPEVEEEAVAATDGDPADLETAALKVIRRRCRSCHVVNSDENGGDTGPPLNREGFGQLYTEKFFRAKVMAPEEFWEGTGMVYNKRKKPNESDLEILVKYFFKK